MFEGLWSERGPDGSLVPLVLVRPWQVVWLQVWRWAQHTQQHWQEHQPMEHPIDEHPKEDLRMSVGRRKLVKYLILTDHKTYSSDL